jgi:transcriptional regulator with XRE-family HTH domain
MTLGERLRFLRQQRGLSASQLAGTVGVSRALISQLERGHANPSIDTLRKIAAALDAPIASFFDDDATAERVVRRKERKTLRIARSGLTYQLLTPNLNGHKIEFLWIELEPGQESARIPFGHPGEECAVVVEGSLHVWIAEKEHVLQEGDSIAFDSGIPHRVANLGPGRTTVISAITPPHF